MNKVAFYTLGCKLNFSETSSIARQFEERGFKKVEFGNHPDILVINTCSVTENADKKCRKIIRDAQQNGQDPYVLVVGCYAQLKPQDIATIPGVDAVLGASEKFKIFDLLDDFTKKEESIVCSRNIEEADAFHNAYSLNVRTRTFLKVQDGCDYSCAFCTIPLARGRSRSDTIENVVRSAKQIAQKGVKEIVLTGVNTGDFGIRNGTREDRFIDLIRALDEVNDIDRFRISSIEPNLLSDEIIEFVAGSKKFMPHFHVPLQSGSNKILKLMRRRYLRKLYEQRVVNIKSLMPQACIGVDVIVGFPGETEDDFLETYRFLNELDISYLHVFSYSERDNTAAQEMDGSVPIKARNERSKMLRTLSVKKRRYFYAQQLGDQARVLFENDIEHGLIHGFTENYIRVAVPNDPLLPNSIKKVRMEGINNEGHVVGALVPDEIEV